jgi:xylulokinase
MATRFWRALALGEVTKDDLPSWNPAARTVKAGRHAAYEAQYPLFKALYEQTKDIAHQLSDRA